MLKGDWAFDPARIKLRMKRIDERIALLGDDDAGNKQSHGTLFDQPAISYRP